MKKFQVNKIAIAITAISMVVIFTFSSQLGETSYTMSGYGTVVFCRILNLFGITWNQAFSVEYFLRKSAHVIMYFSLGVGVSYLISDLLKKYKKPFLLKTAILSMGICTLCGCVDEFIQSTLPGRGGILGDVSFDAVGYVIGILLVIAIQYFKK